MAPAGHTRSSRTLVTLQWGWYGGLVTAAVVLLLVNGDPSAALVLAIVLPLAMLLSPAAGAVASLAAAAGLAGLGTILATRQELDPTLRSGSLAIVMLAPALGLAVAIPMAMRWAHARAAHLGESTGSDEAVGDQSSTTCMSDSTSCSTLGRLTSETKRSKAA